MVGTLGARLKALLQSSQLNLTLSREDILILMIAIATSPFKVSRKISYLQERLAQLDKADEWLHSVLNKDEDRALRYYYLTRGCNHALTDENWSVVRKELASYAFGIDLQNIDRSKIMRFANSTVVIRPSRRSAKASKDGRLASAKATTKTTKLTAKQLEERLLELLK